MENDIDKILSGAFQEKLVLGGDAAFTASLMRKLPRQGIPTKTRVVILFLCTAFATVIPLFTGGYEEFYVWSEEIITDSFFAFQDWMEQLSSLA